MHIAKRRWVRKKGTMDMKKGLTRWINLSLAGALCLSLAACSGGESGSSSGGTDADGVKQLDVWLPATAKDGNDAELWADIVAGWEKENNAKVNFQFIS